MQIHFHTLTGCSPTPLANYLKALAILRIVSEQADSTARGAWRNEAFVLATTLSNIELADFFLNRYAPTSLVSPWNRASGFYGGYPTLVYFETSDLPRLAAYREGVAAARTLCSDLEIAQTRVVEIKNEAKSLKGAAKEALKNDPQYKARLASVEREFKRLKAQFIPECRLKWRRQSREWLNAAIVINSDKTLSWPSLFGTGGADGKLDFTTNFRQRFCDLFDLQNGAMPKPQTHDLLKHALIGDASLGSGNYKVGQFAPGSAGGANSTNGLECGASGIANVNPWDFILFMEGSVLFVSAASRRLNASATTESAPFALRAQPAGHLSSSVGDKSSRGEQWMPLWPQFATLGEIRTLLSEGRAQLGRTSTREPLDMARSVARLGVARGISAFERYAYMERNGQSNFAVPPGRWPVLAQPHQNLLTDLDIYLNRLHKAVRKDNAAGSLVTAAKNLDDALLAATAAAAQPRSWQNVLLALANQYGIRRHFLPINKFGSYDKNETTSVVCFGRDLVVDLVALIDRSLVEASQNASRALDQTPINPRFCARLPDLDAFLAGRVDYTRLLRVARALMALETQALKMSAVTINPGCVSATSSSDVYAFFRFCLAPRHWRVSVPVRSDVFRRLASGDIAAASRLAFQHLRSHGITPPLQLCVGNARLLAAAKAFTLSFASRDALLNTITHNPQENYK
ncbi:MAG TPA: type I-U CRISPR-associated protein Csx17 [Kiritimatiellia bacterium]|nr:type I-U CRISPR-associated protein Csx17 [Kiritimatiellia bacterium]HRU71124.1 type I-U CRISPR-associated protein Csx17 [Kiritimatiellia bacterium]